MGGVCAARPPLCTCGAPQRRPQTLPRQTCRGGLTFTHGGHVAQIHLRGPVPLQTRLSPSKRTRASSAPSGARQSGARSGPALTPARGLEGAGRARPLLPAPCEAALACPFFFSRLSFFLFHLHHRDRIHIPYNSPFMDHSLVAKGLERCAQSLSAVRLFVIPGTEARQAPPSMGSSRQESWRGLPFPPPGIFPTQGSTPCFVSPALAGGFFTTEPAGKPREGTHVTQ